MLVCATTPQQRWESPLPGISNYLIFPFLLMASYLKFLLLPWSSCVTSLHENIMVPRAANTILSFLPRH